MVLRRRVASFQASDLTQSRALLNASGASQRIYHHLRGESKAPTNAVAGCFSVAVARPAQGRVSVSSCSRAGSAPRRHLRRSGRLEPSRGVGSHCRRLTSRYVLDHCPSCPPRRARFHDLCVSSGLPDPEIPQP